MVRGLIRSWVTSKRLTVRLGRQCDVSDIQLRAACPPSFIVPIVFQLVFGILATLAAKDGQVYRYPLSIRLLKSNTFD
ncbi:MAG TPA: hypothetical protein DDZ51_24420 [Planctomycetaceae bacterium]|nr:hypothetical protein [Planctomycetaceae bacterium]